MKLLGLDFDNTLVHYDKLFYKIAIERNLIDKSLPPVKTVIRNFLRDKGKEIDFTLLQGEVYGSRILEAEPADGMIDALNNLNLRGVPMVLVSHKTKFPYKGPSYDMHKAAWDWLESHDFFSPKGLNWTKKDVYFEKSKEEKVERIKSLKCTHYIDDLPEILEMLPTRIKAILYDQNNSHGDYMGHTINSWEKLSNIILE